MSQLCGRWGQGDDQCLLMPGHLGVCRTKAAPGGTLPDYSGLSRMRTDYNAGACLDCGEPARWPSDFCEGCLAARFGRE